MMKEIKEFPDGLVEFKVEYIRREQNLVSDALAKIGRMEAKSDLWFHTCPLDIREICTAQLR
jgi:hypothetical protein